MTVPSERTRSIVKTKRLLSSLLQVPISKWDKRAIRKEIANCLRHYPNPIDLTEGRITDSFETMTFDQADEVGQGQKEETEYYVETITLKKI